jgi:hypothetical protein
MDRHPRRIARDADRRGEAFVDLASLDWMPPATVADDPVERARALAYRASLVTRARAERDRRRALTSDPTYLELIRENFAALRPYDSYRVRDPLTPEATP